MFLHRVNNVQHNIKQDIYTGMEVISLSLILYIKSITLKSDASSEMTNFQRNLFSKIAFLKMKALIFISYIVDNSVCDYLLIYLK